MDLTWLWCSGKMYPIEKWVLTLNMKQTAWKKWVKKGKEVPLQAWSGPEGSRKLRFPDFMRTVQDGG
jgi:hypothetical protein